MDNVSGILQDLIAHELIRDILDTDQFYFQKGLDKYNEFLNLPHPTDENNVYNDLIVEFANFQVKGKYKFGQFLDSKSIGPRRLKGISRIVSNEYKILLVIGQLITYIDRNAYNKADWNEYEDKRHLARSMVRQDPWVINLLKFKANGNQTDDIKSPNILHALAYFEAPWTTTTVLSKKHRAMILESMGLDVNDEDNFNDLVINYFLEKESFRKPVNDMNLGILVSAYLYRLPFRVQWDQALSEKLAAETEGETEDEKQILEKAFEETVEAIEDVQEEEETAEHEREVLIIVLSVSGSPTAQSDKLAVRDRLGRQNLIDALAKLIGHPEQGTPFTIGIFGNWGAGKSSLVDLVIKQLTTIYSGKNKPFKEFKVITFNAWEYERTDNIAVGITQETVKGLLRNENIFRKIYIRLVYAFKMHFWSSLMAFVGIAGFIYSFFFYDITTKTTIQKDTYEVVEGTAEAPADTLKKWTQVIITTSIDDSLKTTKTEKFEKLEGQDSVKVINQTIEPVDEVTTENETYDFWFWFKQVTSGGGFFILALFFKRLSDNPLTTKFISNTKIPDYKEQLGLIPVLKKQIEMLRDITVGHKRRMIVFVDDLDRCSPNTIMKTLEAVHRVVHTERAIILIAIDHRIALKAIAETLGNNDTDRSKEEVARDFLGKLIQLPVKINDPTDDSIANYIDHSLFGNL